MSRTRIFGLVGMLLAAAVLVWIAFFSGESKMKAAVASANGSNYTLELPKDMQPADFNENASFQYTSETGGYSFMVIEDSKEKIVSFGLDYDLDTYMKIASRTLDSAGMYVNTKTEVNKMPALQTTIKGKRDGKEATFILTCVETPTFYYQLIAWSNSDKFETNKPVLEEMINSFSEEIPQPVKE